LLSSIAIELQQTVAKVSDDFAATKRTTGKACYDLACVFIVSLFIGNLTFEEHLLVQFGRPLIDERPFPIDPQRGVETHTICAACTAVHSASSADIPRVTIEAAHLRIKPIS